MHRAEERPHMQPRIQRIGIRGDMGVTHDASILVLMPHTNCGLPHACMLLDEWARMSNVEKSLAHSDQIRSGH